jgi:hypothetical protein
MITQPNKTEEKKWLLDRLKDLKELTKDTRSLIDDLQKSLNPDAKGWIKESHNHIKQNDWLIDTIKKQLARDHELTNEEKAIVASI